MSKETLIEKKILLDLRETLFWFRHTVTIVAKFYLELIVSNVKIAITNVTRYRGNYKYKLENTQGYIEAKCI